MTLLFVKYLVENVRCMSNYLIAVKLHLKKRLILRDLFWLLSDKQPLVTFVILGATISSLLGSSFLICNLSSQRQTTCTFQR